MRHRQFLCLQQQLQQQQQVLLHGQQLQQLQLYQPAAAAGSVPRHGTNPLPTVQPQAPITHWPSHIVFALGHSSWDAVRIEGFLVKF